MARLIILSGEITQEVGKDVTERLYDFNVQSTNKAIHVLIDTCGGSFGTSLALFDLFKHSQAPVYTYAIGSVYSAGLTIFLAGEKRFALPSASFLTHPPQMITDDDHMSPYEMEARGDHGKHLQEVLINLLVRNSNIPKRTARTLVSKDTFFYLEDAHKYGIIHYVLDIFPTDQMLSESPAEIIAPPVNSE